ncbi:MAG: FAD-containing oxidoreductase [bacterium]|nr:FAD-containing oxidoreductase [bacterium]
MKTYDLIVIGFGKAGKTLAAKFAKIGKKVALIEQNPQMYGGTCINIGCIPTKTLINAAEKNLNFEQAMADKTAVVGRLRNKNFENLDNLVDIIAGRAEFIEDKVIKVSAQDDEIILTAENIVINTGSEAVIPQIAGVKTTKNVFDSTEIQNLDNLPDHLAIIGAGNIGLEFARLYNKLGSEVTIFETTDKILPNDEPEVADFAKKYLEDLGIKFKFNTNISRISNDEAGKVLIDVDGEVIEFDSVLYAVGRKPRTSNLRLENTNINLGDRGEILTNQYLETSVEGVFAVGDVNGGPQFTYISLDDYRIVADYLLGNGQYSLSHRQSIPSVVFIDPPLARVGLTEKSAKDLGHNTISKSIPVAAMPRGHVNGDLRGIFKAVVDADTGLILGANFLGESAHELINLVAMAIDNQIPGKNIARQIFTHPTMAENLNDLFDI